MSQSQFRLDRKDFLSHYWQRKPLLIRDALEGFEPPVDADTLAGLALEDEIESRIVEFRDPHWQLTHGPFEAEDFDRQYPWTLLVQAVDHYLPEVAELRKLVDFIPQWRIDDIMISYAVDGGSVGPHFDNYDVFLLQGEGKRKWRLGQRCGPGSALLPHRDLRILENFECEQEYTLATGDILYVPPGVAHWGVAVGECMTYSIGFRAPRIGELLSRSVDSLLERSNPDQFYRDPDLAVASRAGEIRPEDLHRARNQLLAALTESDNDSWFGELVTEPKYEIEFAPDEPTDALKTATGLELLPGSKLAWQQNGSEVIVFTNGEGLHHSEEVIPLLCELCERWSITGSSLATALSAPGTALLLTQLFERGVLTRLNYVR